MIAALRMLDAPTAGVEVESASRRRTCARPLSPTDSVHRRLPHLFRGTVPGRNSDDEDDASDDEEQESSSDNFLGRRQSVQSYSKMMHAHTKFQLGRPTTGTLPSYTKTMHSFTLNQLNDLRMATKSEASSPQLGVGRKHLMLPVKLCSELSKMSLDELPHNPSNTPEIGVDFRKGKRRSITDPIPREFAASVSRDFAGS